MDLSANPSLFEYDYQGMNSHFLSTFGNELIEWQYINGKVGKWKKIYLSFDS
jgi:hypothetical protein